MLHINIAIIGAVSVGKSTLINTLFVDQYSDTKMKRTTALPQIYTESDGDFDENVREKNKKINDDIMKKTEKSKITYEDIKEIHYKVPRIYDFVELKDGVFLQIYDLPGLDDSRTSDVYMEYVEKNFHKFNIIIYVLDITDALNRSDEVKILERILKLINENSKLIIVFNKCDEMHETGDGILVPTDNELIENKDQAINIISSCMDKLECYVEYEYVIMSCEDAYIYRTLHKKPDAKLNSKYIDKFGFNEVGKIIWKKTPEDEKVKIIEKLLDGDKYDERMKMTGFDGLKKLIEQNLTNELQCSYLIGHIVHESECINIDDYKVRKNPPCYIIYSAMEKFNTLKERILNVEKLFGMKNEGTTLEHIFSEFMNKYKIAYSRIFFEKNATSDTCEKYKAVIQTYENAMKLFSDIDYTKEISTVSKNLNQYYIDELEKTENRDVMIEYFAELYNNKYEHIGEIILKYSSRMIAKINVGASSRLVSSIKTDIRDEKETSEITRIIDYINTIDKKFGKTITISKLCLCILMDIYLNKSYVKSYGNLDECMFWNNVMAEAKDVDIKRILYYTVNVILKTDRENSECIYLKLANGYRSPLILEKFVHGKINSHNKDKDEDADEESADEEDGDKDQVE